MSHSFLRGEAIQVVVSSNSALPHKLSNFPYTCWPQCGDTPQPAHVTFTVHKELLASVSPELYSHVFNDMMEGHQGILTLDDVHSDTVEQFLAWVYSNKYKTNDESPASLVPHCRMYCFADRFNIVQLKPLTFQAISEILRTRHSLPDAHTQKLLEMNDSVILGTDICFENLPCRDPTCLTKNIERGQECTGGHCEDLLGLLISFIAWDLKNLRNHQLFSTLLREHPDVAEALIYAVPPAPEPTCIMAEAPLTDAAASGPDSRRDKNRNKLLVKLSSRCFHCNHYGIPSLVCKLCNQVDALNECSKRLRTPSDSASSVKHACKNCHGSKTYRSLTALELKCRNCLAFMPNRGRRNRI
ncbi:hypothetical protein BDZ91DRAFT_739743 [Kalaharituber pfeilii]|nr:hypothetical protein BDZ91DRAFT_739743 [Kalaharituber pfeilii]